MEKHKSNEFAKSISVYTLLVIIINNILGNNIQSINKYDKEYSTTIYIVSNIFIHKIG